jgi:DNA end-binding protein Ku
MFVEKESIDWVWYDSPYYLTPDGEVGEEAYSVIRDAMVGEVRRVSSRTHLLKSSHAVLANFGR